MIQIIDYNEQYAKEVDKLDESYWGVSETEKVSEDIKVNDIIKLAKQGEKIVGLVHFKIIGDLIDAYHILVDSKYQHQGIATILLRAALEEAKKRNFKTAIAHAVEHDGVINAKKLLQKFGFQELYQVKNYWESLYPGSFCKQCESNHCHCGVVVYQKNL